MNHAPTRAASVERVTVALPRLPADFAGATVAVAADLHGGRGRRPQAAAEELVRLINGLRPDLIVLLGDMVHYARDGSQLLPSLSGLTARHGAWACLGNHEHGFVWHSRYLGPRPCPSVEEWRHLYAQAGISLLVNEAKPITSGSSRLWLVAADDAYSRKDDLAAALRDVPRGEFRLAITHSPDLVDDPGVADVDLMLAAHTHGGQVHLPLLGPVWAPCRKPRQRAAGWLRGERCTVYVSRGVGEGLPVRFRCPRELTLMTLGRSLVPRSLGEGGWPPAPGAAE